MNIIKQILQQCRRPFVRFARESRGALIIEGSITLFLFISVIFIVIDLGSAFMTQSRLERASHSLASVLRERVALYGKNEEISEAQVKDLAKLAGVMLNRKALVVKVEAIYFKDDPVQTFDYALTYSGAGSDRYTCRSRLPDIKTLAPMSPWSSANRWMPLYRVSVCLPGEKSWFQSFVNGNSGIPDFVVEEFIASNVVLPR